MRLCGKKKFYLFFKLFQYYLKLLQKNRPKKLQSLYPKNTDILIYSDGGENQHWGNELQSHSNV